MRRNYNFLWVAALSSCLLFSSGDTYAQCSPTTLMARYIQNIQLSDYTELVFVLAAAKDDFDIANKALRSGSQIGLIAGSATFDEARAKASGIAQTIKLNSSFADNENYIAQQLTGNALQDYVHCLTIDHPQPGLTMWLDRREGDYLFLGAYWLGASDDEVGNYDSAPRIRNGDLFDKPTAWKSKRIERLTLEQKDRDQKTYVTISINGRSSTFIYAASPILNMVTEAVQGSTLQATSFRASGTVCGAGFAEGCIVPTHPGGYLVRKSGQLTDFSATITSSAGFSISVDDPNRVCIKLVVSTGACEASNLGRGTISALERFPKAP